MTHYKENNCTASIANQADLSSGCLKNLNSLTDKTFHPVCFVSGIDTGIGKTAAVGALARLYHSKGIKVITQKPIQTGGSGIAEDILTHRKIQGSTLLPEDKDGTTCSYLLPYPASPHLAARLGNTVISLERIDRDTCRLQENYDAVVIEGAGGLMVPMNEKTLTLDFIRERNYPLVLVTCGRLGSINHTLLSLKAAQDAGIVIDSIIYNTFFDDNPVIAADTRNYLIEHIQQAYPQTHWFDLGKF